MANFVTSTDPIRQAELAARAFIDSLNPDQRSLACAGFDSPDRRTFKYVPGPRPGLALADMTDQQRVRAIEMLGTGLSPTGYDTARSIMELETILGDIEHAAGRPGWERRQPDHYWFRVLGEPGDDPWAWKVGGHHLAVHLTVADSRLAVTPQFFGANPARVPDGYDRAGARTLPVEEDLARALVSSLNTAGRERAIAAPLAPRDIITRNDPVVDENAIRPGVMFHELDDSSRGLLVRLVRHYLGRAVPDVAGSAWAEIDDAGLERVSFRWAGPTNPGNGHYYAVLGPTFLLEYDNVQNDANHIHTVWRDLRHDWGDDLLATHRATHAH